MLKVMSTHTEKPLPDAARDIFGDAVTAASQALIWDVIKDVSESFHLAMIAAGVPTDAMIEVMGTVSDYVANNWGDD